MMPSDAMGLSAMAPNSCRGAVASSGCRGAVAVLDAAPLTPMEQQIISELGATDEAIGVEADADKTDGDAADDMLDVLVSFYLKFIYFSSFLKSLSLLYNYF
jgi:hypothetical protein